MKAAKTCFPSFWAEMSRLKSNCLNLRIFFFLDQYQLFLSILTCTYLEVKLTCYIVCSACCPSDHWPSKDKIISKKIVYYEGTSFNGEKLNYKSVAKEISKPPSFGSWSPVGIKVYRVCSIHVSFKCFEPRPRFAHDIFDGVFASVFRFVSHFVIRINAGV